MNSFTLTALSVAFAALMMGSCLAFHPSVPSSSLLVTRGGTNQQQSSALFYKAVEHEDDEAAVASTEELKALTATTLKTLTPTPTPTTTPTVATDRKSHQKRKPVIANLWNLDDLVDFVEEDHRLAVVKFYAPWCKTCQKLDRYFQRLASLQGDVIVDRKLHKGAIRFAEIEYGPRTKAFVEESLQINSIPTLQLYVGGSQHKVFDMTGMTTTKELELALQQLQTMERDQLLAHAEQIDDGVLPAAVEDAFYAPPAFLDEEW